MDSGLRPRGKSMEQRREVKGRGRGEGRGQPGRREAAGRRRGARGDQWAGKSAAAGDLCPLPRVGVTNILSVYRLLLPPPPLPSEVRPLAFLSGFQVASGWPGAGWLASKAQRTAGTSGRAASTRAAVSGGVTSSTSRYGTVLQSSWDRHVSPLGQADSGEADSTAPVLLNQLAHLGLCRLPAAL